jgi:hypothetical protein
MILFISSTKRQTCNCNRILGITLVLGVTLASFVAFGSSAQSTNSNNSVTVKFEGDYPWLVQGAYADYITIYFGQAPWFVTSSGQLLMMAPELPGTPNNPVNGWIPGTGSASLNWTVLNRTDNYVSLGVAFHAAGCQDNETAYKIMNQSAAPCTYYNYSSKITVLVNLTTNEAYVNGVDQGLLNFWNFPLIQRGTILDGSVFVNQTRFDSSSNVSALLVSTSIALPPGMQSVKVSGIVYTNPITLYELTPSSFGIPNSNYRIGWLNGSGSVIGSNIQESPFGPFGYYDYYNGLAYMFSMPQFPIDQTICEFDHGQPMNCQLANVSTTLGLFFRSGLGTFLLRSTNISLGPDQQQSSGSQTNALLTETAEVTIPLAVIGIATFLIHRKRLGRNLGRRAPYKSA